MRCPPDSDGRYPIAFLQGTDYALFKDGRIAQFEYEGIQELNSHYSFYYHDILNISDLKLSQKDEAPLLISKFKTHKWRITFSISLILGTLLLDYYSITIIDMVQNNFNTLSSWLMGLSIFFIGFCDFFIPSLFERKKHTIANITLNNSLNNRQISLSTDDISLHDNNIDLIIGATRLGIIISLVIAGDVDSIVRDMAVLMAMPILFLITFNSNLFIEAFARRKLTKIQDIPSLEFYHKISEIRAQAFIDYRNNKSNENQLSIEELLGINEGSRLEFKGSMWTKYETSGDKYRIHPSAPRNSKKDKNYDLQDGILKTIAAFLNSGGGTLLIGVQDKDRGTPDGISAKVCGIENDFFFLQDNKQDTEGYNHALIQIFNHAFDDSSIVPLYIDISFPKYQEKIICRIDVEKVPKIKDGQKYARTKTLGECEFFYRVDDSTEHPSLKSAINYINNTFPHPYAKEYKLE